MKEDREKMYKHFYDCTDAMRLPTMICHIKTCNNSKAGHISLFNETSSFLFFNDCLATPSNTHSLTQLGTMSPGLDLFPNLVGWFGVISEQVFTFVLETKEMPG